MDSDIHPIESTGKVGVLVPCVQLVFTWSYWTLVTLTETSCCFPQSKKMQDGISSLS
jgi:hypothetical protein